MKVFADLFARVVPQRHAPPAFAFLRETSYSFAVLEHGFSGVTETIRRDCERFSLK